MLAIPVSTSRRGLAQSAGTVAGEWSQPANIGGANAMLGFTADFPFHAIAPHWSGETDFPAAVEMQLSADGEIFSDPLIVGPASVDAGPKDRDGRVFGHLISTDTATSVRYRGLDADGNDAGIPGLSFTYIDATGGPTLGDISPSTLNPSLDRPPIVSRDEWGANLAYGGSDRGASEWTPQYQTVEHVIIHHSETPSFRDPLAEIRSIHFYHAVTRGWGDIGYNYLVDFLGNVYEGRIGGENVVGGHAYQYAHGSAGICSMGSFSLENSTPEAIAGLTWITAWAGRLLDPLGQSDFHEVPNLPTICAHRDVNESTCPGDGLYADLPSIRGAVAEVIASNRDVLSDPQFSPGQIVATNAEGANLRALPGTDRTVTTPLPYGAVLQVIEGPTTVGDHQWFQVFGDDGEGWIASSLISPSDALPPVGKYAVGDKLVVDTDSMNIRSEPTLRSLIMATLPYNEPVDIVEGPMPASGYRWYRLNSAYGSGWAAEQHLIAPGARKPESRFTIGDAVAVDDPDGLKLRIDASPSATVIVSLPYGTRGAVTDGPKLDDRITWLKIQTPLGTGWCAEPFLIESSSADPVEARFALGDQVIVDTDALNVREAPGVDSTVILSLGTGVSGKVVNGPELVSNLNWFQLETAYGTGWCAETFLAASDADPSSRAPVIGDIVFVDTDGINLRTEPGIAKDIVAVLFQAETGEVIDGPVDTDGYPWIQLRTDRGTGWGVVQFLGIGNPDPANASGFTIGDTIAVDTDGVNVRAAPALDAEVMRILLAGEQTSIVDGPQEASGFTWFKVVTDVGEGWTVDRYFRLQQASGLIVGSTARVIDGELNLRTGAGIDNDVLAILPDSTFVDLIEGPVSDGEADWFRVRTSRFGAGWCSGAYLVRA
jgi:uncharacterized protein YgiM (DUF1202 family)